VQRVAHNFHAVGRLIDQADCRNSHLTQMVTVSRAGAANADLSAISTRQSLISHGGSNAHSHGPAGCSRQDRPCRTRSGAMSCPISLSDAGAPRAQASSPPGLVHRLVRRIHRAVLIRKMRSELQQLPDYLLKDIGVNRSEIDSVVAGIVDGTFDRTRHARGKTESF
jgi:uncharacterized protein YjiS (DUF1127 family)